MIVDINITVDPPYYDNVQYAELADFFYVWLKRSVGHLFPEFFTDELTNKDDEAVANPARFETMGRKKKDWPSRTTSARWPPPSARCTASCTPTAC
jgi:hypothetical protein